MRIPILLLAAFALTLPGIPAYPQDLAPDQIVRAHRLWSEGQAKAAIAILQPMLQAGGNGAPEIDLGIAWNVLGSCYEDLEMYGEARRAFDNAIEKLRRLPSAETQYAAAIDNLATLEQSLGQRDAAKALAEKASRIYEALGDHAGIAIASTNLAVIAYTQKDFKSARRSLARAFEEAQHTTQMRDDDLAQMDDMKSALALHDGKDEEAISTIQQAIDRWTRAHGPGYFMLGTGYLLRAQALAKSGDYARAIADAQHALAIAAAAIGRNTLAYVTAETVYAQILRASGAKEQAARLKKEANSALADLESRQCNGCTIDANGFR